MRFNVYEKPHRLPRECYLGLATVSFTACIKNRQTPFLDDEVCKLFLEKLSTIVAKNQCIVLIYCFMPDHLHLILHGTSATADTWQAMVDFKQQTGFWFAQNGRRFAWQKDASI